MKIDTNFIESKLRESNISFEQFGKMLGMTGEGFRKILAKKATKAATIKAIAEKLGVQPYELSKEMPQPLSFRQGNSDPIIRDLEAQIAKHEKKINHLKDHIVKIYVAIGKPDEINKIR